MKKRFMTYANNHKGVTLVLMAFMLALLIMFASLAIDIAYMYFVKNQLQVAADAAALAGAAKLTGDIDNTTLYPNALHQEEARQGAWRFACKNKAAGTSVYLVTNSPANCDATPPSYSALNGDNNTDGEDIVVGHWDSSAGFTRATGLTGLTINAIRARPRRTNETSGIGMPPVGLFLGKIFNIIGTDWSFMDVSASAIGSRPPKATAAISLCDRTCTELAASVTEATPLTLYWAPYPSEVDPGNQGTAWTVFSETTQSTPTNELIPFFCGTEGNACNLTIYSSNGNNNAAMRQFRCAFLNPLYDSDRKTCADGVCDSSTDNVTRWKIIVPVFDSAGCPPGAQPQPYLVVKWAEVTVKQVFASGGGGTNYCACGQYNAGHTTGPTDNAITVTKIECTSCSDSSFIGRKVALVK
jgi:Flp pilus assembly protein TadG